MNMENSPNWTRVGRDVVDDLLSASAPRSSEIIAGVEGERFHTHDIHRLVLLLTDGKASQALQIAAMGHDAERFAIPGAGSGYSGRRSGPEYVAYKKRHARVSANLITALLREKNVPNEIVEKVHFLITHHDDPLDEIEKLNDQELETLVAADTLSWLNFSAPNYFNGKEERGIPGLLDKMDFMLRKLPEKYWSYVPRIELIESRIFSYLKERVAMIARERNIPVPEFHE